MVGDAHDLPFGNGSFDFIVCVGSVVNYVSLNEVAAEFARVLRPLGTLLVEYERMTPFPRLRPADVTPHEVTYRGQRHICWLYSDTYVESVFRSVGFRVRTRRSFHVASNLLARLNVPSQVAAAAAFADTFLRGTALESWAANAVIRFDLTL